MTAAVLGGRDVWSYSIPDPGSRIPALAIADTLKFTNGVDATVTKDITIITPTGKALIRERFE